MKSNQVVNLTGGVETDDGRTLFGYDAEVYERLKAKEDPELERQVGQWIEDVLDIRLVDTCNLFASLKSGVVLCQLVNKLKPGIIRKFNDKQDPLHALQERENINLYLDACWRLGVGKSDIFITSDLHGRRSIPAVIQNVTALSQIAGRANFTTVPPIGPAQNRLNKKEPSKWDRNIVSENTYVGQLGIDVETQLRLAQEELAKTRSNLEKLEKQNVAINTELSDYREKVRALKVEKSTLRERPASTNRSQLTKSRAEMMTLERQKLAGVTSSTGATSLTVSDGEKQQQAQHVRKPSSATGPIKCDACRHVNDVGRMFCGECGQKLTPTPPSAIATLSLTSSSSPRPAGSQQQQVRTQNLQHLKDEQ